VRPETRSAWLVAYLPEGVVARERCGEVLAELVARAGAVRATT